MHEMDARLPNECIIAQACTFVSEYIPFLFQVPSYMEWLGTRADWEYPYLFYRKMLQLWQWRNPRRHWLLKAPSHLNYLPTLFKVFPDARVLLTHRDPLKAQASVTNLAGTFYWMRSDKPLDVTSFESLLSPEHMAARLERVIDWLEDGTIPRAQCANSRYADLIDAPWRPCARSTGRSTCPSTSRWRRIWPGIWKASPRASSARTSTMWARTTRRTGNASASAGINAISTCRTNSSALHHGSSECCSRPGNTRLRTRSSSQ